jgi:hypothetical protein
VTVHSKTREPLDPKRLQDFREALDYLWGKQRVLDQALRIEIDIDYADGRRAKLEIDIEYADGRRAKLERDK